MTLISDLFRPQVNYLIEISTKNIKPHYCTMRMHSVAYAVAYVCLSVCHTPVFCLKG